MCVYMYVYIWIYTHTNAHVCTHLGSFGKSSVIYIHAQEFCLYPKSYDMSAYTVNSSLTLKKFAYQEILLRQADF